MGGESSGVWPSLSTYIQLVIRDYHLWISSGGEEGRTFGRGRLRTLDTKLLTTNFVSHGLQRVE